MEPLDVPPAPPRTTCTDCDDPLPPGNRWRCWLCQEAAELAVREARGQVVRPSDVARVRARLGED